MVNGVGIGDPDFSGDKDEYHAPCFNSQKNQYKFKKGERIAQAMFVKFAEPKMGGGRKNWKAKPGEVSGRRENKCTR